MKTKPPLSPQELRHRAEELYRASENLIQEPTTHEGIKQLLHELRVHQIQLEMQNEELRCIQEELDASQSRYFDLYDLAPVGYMTFGEPGLILEANLAAANMFGVARSALIKQPIKRFLCKEDQDLFYLHRQQAFKSNAPQVSEMLLKRPDGSCFWAQVQATPAAGGEFWITFSDISKRKMAEEERDKTKDMLSLFIKHSPIYTYIKEVTSTESRVLIASDNFEQMIGIPGSEIVGKAMTALFPAELAVKIAADDWSVIANGNKLQLEEAYNGRSYDTIKFPVVLGEKTLLAGFSIDTTERKQTENALRMSREKYKATIDNSFDVIFSLNAEGTFQFVSRAWERHFGYPIKEVLGKNFAPFVHPDDIAPLTTYLGKVISSGKSKTSPPYRVKRSDGTWRTFTANGSRYANTDNEWQFIGVAHDNTDQLAAEQNLLQAKAAAESANIAKSQFLSTMSHEIRTPMNSVLGVIQLLQQDELTEEQRELTEIAMQSGKKLVDLLNDILDLAKIEAGKIELEIADFDLPSMISDTINLLALQAREKGLLLTSSQDIDVPSALKGDAGRLRQIIINLVGNAIKFTPKGTITLHIQKCSEDAHSTTLCFVIHDSGIGIAADKLEHIFESFTQANGSTTRTYGGTGLGLAICKSLVELMGGTISVESSDGGGSTFQFTVVLENQVEASLLQPSFLEETHREPFNASGIRILLTEDDPVAQKIVSKLLQSCGYLVDVVCDGKEAVDALVKNDYALVLMDCMMPEMNGYEVTAVIRDPASEVRRHDIPVIALTGNAMRQDCDYCLAAGMDDHLTKPVLFPDLLAMLEKWLRGETK